MIKSTNLFIALKLIFKNIKKRYKNYGYLRVCKCLTAIKQIT